MSSQDFPFLSMSESNCGDRATAAILAAGGADGLPAFALRQWRSGIPGTQSWRRRCSSPGCPASAVSA